MEKVVRASVVVGELAGRWPSPAEAGQLEVGDGDGALGGAPCRGEGVRASGVKCVEKVRGAKDVGFVCGVAKSASGVAVEEADGSEGSSFGLGSHGVRGELWKVAERASRYASDFGAVRGGGAEP